MAFGLDLGPGARDAAVRIDQERAAGDAPVGLAVVLLLDPAAVGVGDGMVLVGQQRERQAELLAEGALAGRSLRADAPDVGAALVDGLVGVAELARLDGATGRVVLGIEVQDGPAPTLVVEVVDGARGIGQGDSGSGVADRRHVHAQSVAGVSTTRSWPRRSATVASGRSRMFESPRVRPSSSGSSRRA